MWRMIRTLILEDRTFSAAHYLPEVAVCQRLHGHTYFIKNLELDVEGFVDFRLVDEAIGEFDHTVLVPADHLLIWRKIFNTHDFLRESIAIPIENSPTVENISLSLQSRLRLIPGVKEVRFTLFEGPHQGVDIY